MDTNDKMNTGNVASDRTMNSLDQARRLTLLESYTGRLVGIVEALMNNQGKLIESITDTTPRVFTEESSEETTEESSEETTEESSEETVEEIDDGLTDAEADSDTLASAGYGTDESYGGTDERL